MLLIAFFFFFLTIVMMINYCSWFLRSAEIRDKRITIIIIIIIIKRGRSEKRIPAFKMEELVDIFLFVTVLFIRFVDGNTNRKLELK